MRCYDVVVEVVTTNRYTVRVEGDFDVHRAIQAVEANWCTVYQDRARLVGVKPPHVEFIEATERS